MLDHPRLASICLASALLLLGAACSSIRGPVSGRDQDDDTDTLPPADRPIPTEQAQIPIDDDADWIQLVSGEWLRGELIRIRDDQVDFSSDELDDQSFDFADVQTIRTANAQVIVTHSEQTLRGKMVLVGDDLWIESDRTVRIDRSELFATLAFDGDDAIEWSGEVTLGATIRSGNTRQSDTTAFAQVIRETVRTRWTNTYNGATSRTSGRETANNHRLRSIYDIYLTDRLFLTVPRAELFKDRFQNIDYRVIAGGAVGYELIDTARHDWSVSVGPAYQHTSFEEAAPGERLNDDTLAGVLNTAYAWDITSNIDFDLAYTIAAAIPDTHEYNHNLVARLSFDLIGDFDLDITFVWDRVNRPTPDDSGALPRKDDYRTTIGLGWSF